MTEYETGSVSDFVCAMRPGLCCNVVGDQAGSVRGSGTTNGPLLVGVQKTPLDHSALIVRCA